MTIRFSLVAVLTCHQYSSTHVSYHVNTHGMFNMRKKGAVKKIRNRAGSSLDISVDDKCQMFCIVYIIW